MLLAAIALACTAPEPLAEAAPQEASVYLEVAKEEAARGETETALVAAKEALRRDPMSAEAHALFETLCEAGAKADPFELALQRLDAEDPRGALEQVARARELRDLGAEGALVEGIAAYQLGLWESSRQALELAQKDDALAAQAGLYLGLVALAQGDRTEAQVRFSSLTGGADPRLSQLSRDILRDVKNDGRLVLRAALDLRHDSNVGLLPDGSAPHDRGGDLAAVVDVGVSSRPLASGKWLAFGVGALHRQQAEETQESFGGVSATARVDGAWARWQGALEAAWETDWRGGALYLNAPRVSGALRWDPLGPFVLRASWRTRAESYLDDTLAVYSGLRHTGALELGVHGPRVGAWLSWRGERDATGQAASDYVETGPSLQIVGMLPLELRAGLFALYGWREFGLREAGNERHDDVVQGELWLDRKVGDHVTVRASAGVNRLFSNDATAAYTNVYGSVGAQVQWGLW